MKDGSHISTGSKGENIACAYLVEKGYRIVERNFRRKWGEIDAICIVPRGTIQKNSEEIVPRGTIFNKIWKLIVPRGTKLRKDWGRIVFVEIKTLYMSTLQPEDNMTLPKRQKLIRTCELYLSEQGIPLESDWQIDVVSVVLNRDDTVNDIRHIEQAVY